MASVHVSNGDSPAMSFTPRSLLRFGPRVGKLTFRRNQSVTLEIDTPGILTATSRGLVPHLTADHRRTTQAIRGVYVPFESFLEQSPPVPTLQTGPYPFHTFLGFSPTQHVLFMSARDPFDGSEMPPNGKDHVSAHCVRGVRKITPSSWRTYVEACKPDIVVALSDTPFTPPPHSQKRLTKSIERSASWLAGMLSTADSTTQHPSNVLVHLAGGTNIQARVAFANMLLEVLSEKEAQRVKPYRCLDEGVVGYVFDSLPLRMSLAKDNETANSTPPDLLDSVNAPIVPKFASHISSPLLPILRSSLEALPATKPRIVNSAVSPHEVLRLIQGIGIDLFDAHWAQRAAEIGVALDFRFPVVPSFGHTAPRERAGGKRDLGHNLFDQIYANDFSRLADCFLDAVTASQGSKTEATTAFCPCMACSPTSQSTHLTHSSLDPQSSSTGYLPPYTRAYLHHLLHTHEMSSYSLLVMHNLSVLDAFFTGVRSTISDSSAASFNDEVARFVDTYDEEMVLFEEARVCWAEVELARGKGRLAREKAKEEKELQERVVEM